MAELEKIQFVHEDGDLIIAEAKAYYETLLKRQIAPADLEMLLINGLAYRELLLRAGINDAARQNLVAFARGYALELLGELVGVYRLPASRALTTIQFVLVAGHTGVVIPAGIRIQSTDGKSIFGTTEEKVVPPGTLTADIPAMAQDAGSIANGFDVNKINIILDPQAFIATAQNITVSQGGADEETDDQLRERIKLAPASFSVAGPVDAYKFFAKSSHPSIIDVAVTSPVPGQVNIYPLLEGGELPGPEILDAVEAVCNADKIRPLTDTVIVDEPVIANYSIEVNVTLLTTAVAAAKKAEIENALNSYTASRKNRLGLDVVRAKIASICMLEKVYDVEVESPVANIEAEPEKYTNCTGITVNIVGTHDE